MNILSLDCTLRDGGYYNNWDFSKELIRQYVISMTAAHVDIIEVGFRSLINNGFKGACAYATDDFISSLGIPSELAVAVMVNASELVEKETQKNVLQKLFPNTAANSPVSIVRIACHIYEFEDVLSAVTWLKQKGYRVGLNVMQIAERSEEEVCQLAKAASQSAADVLYFADSMGSLNPEQTSKIIRWLRKEWRGALGIHTHDNQGLALSNTLRAIEEGVTWVDSTVTGMGRGPGNTKTEELAIELGIKREQTVNMVPLMQLVNQHFKPMQQRCGWGTNPYYYLAGKYGIHPTYIQEMLTDTRFKEEDVMAVIAYLHQHNSQKFNQNILDTARLFYHDKPEGKWNPESEFAGKEVLLLGTGAGVAAHRDALEKYIQQYQPLVIALNTQESIEANLIDYRIACHPVRLLADCIAHVKLPQPLITPFSMLPDKVQSVLKYKQIVDFGIEIKPDTFEFWGKHCVIPAPLVMAYAFAVITSGKARRILLAGFDGYPEGDNRNREMNQIVLSYKRMAEALPLLAVTPTKYDAESCSIYGMLP